MRVTNNSSSNAKPRNKIFTDTGPFAIVPEWLLDSELSDRAVRLYAILSRYADSDGYSWPSRKTLADRLRRSVNALDRAVRELVESEVLIVTARYSEHGDRTSNGYALKRVAPTLIAGGSKNGDTGSDTDDSTRAPINVTLMKANVNESHLELIAPTSDAPKTVATRKADIVWDTVLEVCGIEGDAITKSSRGAYNRACADLREIGATRKTIIIRATVFRRRWPEVSLTPTALARRWPECDPEHQHGTRAPLLPSEQSEMSALLNAWETK